MSAVPNKRLRADAFFMIVLRLWMPTRSIVGGVWELPGRVRGVLACGNALFTSPLRAPLRERAAARGGGGWGVPHTLSLRHAFKWQAPGTDRAAPMPCTGWGAADAVFAPTRRQAHFDRWRPRRAASSPSRRR